MTGFEEFNNKIKNNIEKYVNENPKVKEFSEYLLLDKSLTTTQSYLYIVNDFIKHINKDCDALTSMDFISYINYVKYKSNGVEKESSSIITIYHALKNYGEYLKEKGYYTTNLMESVKRPKKKESQRTLQKREKGFLTKEEIKEIIKCVKEGVGSDKAKSYQSKMKERDLAIIILFLTTGIRVSAMVKLDVDNIHLVDNTMTLTEKGSIVRTYQLSQQTINVLIAWMIKREELLGKNSNEKALFLNQYNNRMQHYGFSEIITKYTINIEGKHITPHKLRATYGTQLYEATKDIYFVQKAMGHSSPTTTERYIRGQHDTTKKASDIMENLL